jgi:hypothetical protein
VLAIPRKAFCEQLGLGFESPRHSAGVVPLAALQQQRRDLEQADEQVALEFAVARIGPRNAPRRRDDRRGQITPESVHARILTGTGFPGRGATTILGRLNRNPFDLIEGDLIARAIIELSGARAFVRRHGLCILQRAACLKIRRDSRCPEGVTADPDVQAKCCGTALDHTVGIDAVHARGGESPGAANRGAEEGAFALVAEAEAAAIRAAYDQGGEFTAAVELRRLFPGIVDNAKARECVRIIAAWAPIAVPQATVTRLRPRRR